MPPAIQAIFDDWSPPIFLTTMVLLSAIVYTRGWFAFARPEPPSSSCRRLAAFLSGLALLWLAIGSPMDGFADALLSAHMVEHLLLMSFVPPLLLLGDPQVPLLRGLPHILTVHLLGPLLRLKALRTLGRFLTRPLVAWLAMNLIFLGWHVPSAYDFALEHEYWHDFEHICFPQFLNSLLVAPHPPVADQRALPRLVHDPVPGRRRHRQYRAFGLPRLLRPSRLQRTTSRSQTAFKSIP
jgi:putative membrane protein